MARIARRLAVDGHDVAVLESLEEEGPSFLVSVDGVVVNPDAPLAGVPVDAAIRAAVRAWCAGPGAR